MALAAKTTAATKAKPPRIDVLLDRDGLWTTATGQGRGVMRSLPVPGGMAPGRVWSVDIDLHLGQWLADHLDPAAGVSSQRAITLGHLTALALRAAEHPVPTPTDDGWRWRAAPGTALAGQLRDAASACLTAGLVVDDDPEIRLQAFLNDIVHARVAAAVSGTELPVASLRAKSGRRGALLWSDHVIARAGANARTCLMFSPPDPDVPSAAPRPGTTTPSPASEPTWTLAPLAIRIDEPTTRLPWASADPALFSAGTATWQTWANTEMLMLRRAWGTNLSDVADAVCAGEPVGVAGADVLEFLDQVAPRLQAAGFDVIAPGGLLRRSPVRRRLSASGPGTGTMSVDGLSLEAEVLVDGEALSLTEFATLAASKSELVSVRGRWLRIGPQDSQRLAALARRLQKPVDATDLLTDEAFEGVDLDTDQILPHGLRPARPIEPPKSVLANLRHYQLSGLEWLAWLADNHIGGILADDMGLGKTLQVLAWIQSDHPGPTLVVCPVTLVDTWARQAAEFTPDLRVSSFHGADRGQVTQAVEDADILVTTYGLLARDPSLAQMSWHRVVLDEAQAIKNPDTRAARAARTLNAAQRLVVTGTPVENHLGDLWSLMAFAQPGLLPRRKQFTTRFANGEPEDVALLRAVVGPFLLRRVKTDPGILPDLPDRQVIRADCTLTREQVGAYEAVVADMMGALQELRDAAAIKDANTKSRAKHSDPALMGRRAAVLGGISRLKQICVHPALLTESRRGLGERSGKVSRLVELCAQIVDEGQAVVVFTQFASFVPDLADHLRHSLGVEVATLTGSDSRKVRSATVTAFSQSDGPPILVASLKAGGTGLTLVRANHVIHLDRWWNPAVEDQASDRVWRIGQHQKVSVHVMVCPGTLEDRIDEALASKRKLAASVVRSTDAAITEMNDDDLADLVGLVRERVLE